MRKSFLWAIAACLTLTVACYDDSELQTKVDDLQTTVTKIESRVKDLESKVAGLQSIATLVENGYLVKSYEALSDGTGYTLTLVKGSETKVITIKNGVDGENGTTPSVTIEKKGDVYYWVINGVMTDYAVTGNDGKDGKDGKTPQFKLADGVWMVSFDGTTWEKVATEGFAPVSVSLTENNDGTVTLVVDGKSIVLPVAKDFAVKVTLESNNIGAGQTVNATYTLTGVESGDEVSVELFVEGPYKAEIIPGEANTEGKIAITAPDDIATGKIIVFAANGKGKADMKAIKVATVGKVETKTEAGIEITEALAVEAAGTDALKVNVVSNIDYAVATDADWVTYEITTKATHDEFLVLNVKPNVTLKARTATIKIVAASDKEVVLQTLELVQAAKPAESLAELKTLAPEKLTDTSSEEFTATLKNAVVSYVASTSQFFVQDATAGMYVYLKDHNLVAGTTINGTVKGKITRFNGQREVTNLDASSATITMGEVPAPTVVTIAELNADFDAYENMLVKLTEVKAGKAIAKGNNVIYDGDDETILYVNQTTSLKIAQNNKFDIVAGIPLTFKDGTQEVKIFKDDAIENIAETTPTFSKVWGKYPTEWPTFTNNLDRNAALGDNCVYVVKAGGSAKGIWAIDLKDPSKVTEVNTESIKSEGTFATSCVKTIYNPTTGKRILLVSNLALEGGVHLYLYAYENGIDKAPTVLLSDYTLPTWAERRFGDFFTVVGDWSNGYIWFRTNTSGASTTARWKIVDGKIQSQTTPDGWNYGYAASQGKGAFYQLSMDAKLGLLITGNIGMFYDLNSAEGQTWGNNLDNSNFKNLFGFTPFEFNGKKYLAFTKMYNQARAWLTVINCTDDYKADLETFAKDGSNIAFQHAVQIDEEGASTNIMAGATHTDQNTGSCDVLVTERAAYIMGHLHNVGVSVFKLSLE